MTHEHLAVQAFYEQVAKHGQELEQAESKNKTIAAQKKTLWALAERHYWKGIAALGCTGGAIAWTAFALTSRRFGTGVSAGVFGWASFKIASYHIYKAEEIYAVSDTVEEKWEEELDGLFARNPLQSQQYADLKKNGLVG